MRCGTQTPEMMRRLLRVETRIPLCWVIWTWIWGHLAACAIASCRSCAVRNITIIAIAIPFSAAPGDPNQFDPEFTKKSSEQAGFKYLPIPYEGLYTSDWVHLSYEFELRAYSTVGQCYYFSRR